MSDTLKVIHVCDHNITEKIVVRTDPKVIVRAAGVYFDTVTDNIIDSVVKVSQGDVLYSENMHYQISGSNKIKWITAPSMMPAPLSSYTIEMNEALVSRSGYDISECPRCDGNGWYVSACGDSEKLLDSVTGVDKLVQDYMKILLTDSRYYTPGTHFPAIVGSIIKNESEAESSVISAIRSAEEQLKKIQYALKIKNTPVPTDEELKEVIIDDIIISDSRDSFYVKIILISQSSNTVSLGLNL